MKFKRPLVLLLVLALAMSAVTGGTIAWFTDEVTSANNIIKAGNLDVELYHKNNTVTTEAQVGETTPCSRFLLSGNLVLLHGKISPSRMKALCTCTTIWALLPQMKISL